MRNTVRDILGTAGLMAIATAAAVLVDRLLALL